MTESLPHYVVELILERLHVNNVKSLLRFRAVSKQWKSTIDSPFFQERLLKERQQSGDPDVLMVSVCTDPPDIESSLRTLVLGSSSSVNIPTPWEKENTRYWVCWDSCDGLVCLYNPWESGFVVNPTTRWYRPLPLTQLQQLRIDLGESFYKGHLGCGLGFGKDIFTGTYKPVLLYNSSEISLENETTCEVFDFSTNAWRYVTPAAPFRIAGGAAPAFVDGCLHWFTDCEETKVVSFDLHTEVFQVICKAPFAPYPYLREPSFEIIMFNLDNRLCVSEMKWPNQLIWSFDSGNKTWDKICSIKVPVDMTSASYGYSTLCAFHPLALLDRKKKKKTFLFYDHLNGPRLWTRDPESEKDTVVFRAKAMGYLVCYYPSLISIK